MLNAKCKKDASLTNANEQMTLAGIFEDRHSSSGSSRRRRPKQLKQPPDAKTKPYKRRRERGSKSCLSKCRVFASWLTAATITAHNVNSSTSESGPELEVLARSSLLTHSPENCQERVGDGGGGKQSNT